MLMGFFSVQSRKVVHPQCDCSSTSVVLHNLAKYQILIRVQDATISTKIQIKVICKSRFFSYEISNLYRCTFFLVTLNLKSR